VVILPFLFPSVLGDRSGGFDAWRIRLALGEEVFQFDAFWYYPS
jgi:hypothetical protein